MCVDGARAAQRVIVQGFPLADVSISIIWINMLSPDSEDTARVSAEIIQDSRVRHFHDPERRVGRAIAESMGGQGQVAWDMYLFYARNSEWGNVAPVSTRWVHQLQDDWADLTRRRRGNDLVAELCKIAEELIGEL